MSRRYQNGCLYREQRKSGPDIWVFRSRDGQVNRKEQVGTVEQFPTKSAAMKACELLRANINRETRSPRTVAELVAHYQKTELSPEGHKAHSTRAMYGSYIRTWILPVWGDHSLTKVKAVAVEKWLGTLPLANASRAKIRNIMHAIFTHAMRYEWLNQNPISFVRQSAKRQRLPDVLTAEEIGMLLAELTDHCRTAVLLAACTGLRVSELLGLKWSDVDFDKGEIRPCRAIVDQVVGGLKTEASGKPVPMDAALAEVLLDWRGRCPYNRNEDFLFGSPEKAGRQPYWPDSLLRRVIRPAAVRAGIGKHIGWHSFRRTLATLMQGLGASVKATQDMLRQASSRVTMDLYAQSVLEDRRMAQTAITGAILAASVPKRSLIKSQVVVGA
jgi:integrase